MLSTWSFDHGFALLPHFLFLIPDHVIMCVKMYVHYIPQDCIFNKPNIQRIILACRGICKFFNTSTNIVTELVQLQEVILLSS